MPVQDPSASDDNFEVVPQDADEDVDMWAVEGEDEDRIRQATIQSRPILSSRFW